jgi:hypothetical protein
VRIIGPQDAVRGQAAYIEYVMKKGKSKPARTRLHQLITEALVDAYTQEEQHGAFLVMLQDRVVCPFNALVVGEEVEVRRFEWEGGAEGIVAVCYRRGRAHRVNVTALRWAGAPPVGAEWIDAYRLWLSGQW